MRLADYRCAVCGHIKEDHDMNTPPPKCPHCKDRPLMWRKFKSVGVTYKADGFTGAQKGKEGRDGDNS